MNSVLSTRAVSVGPRPKCLLQLETLEALNPPNNMLGLAWDFGLGTLPVDPLAAVSVTLLRDSAQDDFVSAPLVVGAAGANLEAHQELFQSTRPDTTRLTSARATDLIFAEGAQLQTLVWSGEGGGEGGSITGMPDLIVDRRTLDHQRFETRTFAAGSCSIAEGHVPGPGTFRLMRFTTTYPNIGSADLAIGDPLAHPELFEYDTCHRHYHFKEYADYRLWTTTGYAQWRTLRDSTSETVLSRDLLNAHPELAPHLVEGAKRGFCIIDVKRYNNDGPQRPQFTNCLSNQGISVGWADEYSMGLDGQWINVTGRAPGNYMLEVEVNAEHLFAEGNYANNDTAVSVRIR